MSFQVRHVQPPNREGQGQSEHACLGAAIDINIKFADHWLWSKSGYRNRIPMQIVEFSRSTVSSGVANGANSIRYTSSTFRSCSRLQIQSGPRDDDHVRASNWSLPAKLDQQLQWRLLSAAFPTSARGGKNDSMDFMPRDLCLLTHGNVRSDRVQIVVVSKVIGLV